MDIAADGRVGAHDLLPLRLAALLIFDVKVGGERDVLADGQAEDAVLAGQFEAVDGGVVRGDGLLLDGEFLECIGVEDGDGFGAWCALAGAGGMSEGARVPFCRNW